ncbi:MAG: hypothetical protein QOC92_3029 [Acidimicrobiaceae bacterium]
MPTVPLTVVFVDDDPDMVELVRISVGSEPDFELVATTGEASAVLDLVRKHHPDIVILDHRLDDPSSPDEPARCRGVRAHQSGLELVEGTRVAVPDATIAIFSGRSGLSDAARNVGADLHVQKPGPMRTLWSSIREARAVR